MGYKYEKQMYDFMSNMANEKEIPEESVEQLYLVSLKSFIEYLSEHFCDTPINNITEHIVDKYLVDQKEKWQNATVTNRFRVLNYFFDYLDINMQSSDVFKTLKLSSYLKTKDKVIGNAKINIEVFNNFERYIDDPNNNIKERLILALIARQGLKKGELINLKRSKIDFDFGLIYTAKSKTGRKSVKYLVNSVSELLKEYIDETKVELNAPLLGYGNTKDSGFNAYFDKLTIKVCDHKLTPNDLREYLRLKLLAENIDSLNVVTRFFDESLTATNTTVSKYKLYKEFPLDEHVMKLMK